MAVVTAAIIGGLASVAGSAIQGAGASKQAKAQAAAAQAAGKKGREFVKSQSRLLRDLEEDQFEALAGVGRFVRSQNVFEFADETQESLDTLFRAETEQKRENLEFVFGESIDDIREAQRESAALAAGNFSGFMQELEADTVGILAGTEGRPIGAFENLAARNRLLARSRGISESLALSDFIAREGTVDPPSALSVFGAAQGVAEFEAREDAEELAFRERQLDRELNLRDAFFNKRFEISRLGLLAEADALRGAAASAGIGSFAAGSTLQTAGAAVGNIAQAYATRDAAAQNKEFQEGVLSIMRQQALQQNSAALAGSTGV